jgi:hypothetical protein
MWRLKPRVTCSVHHGYCGVCIIEIDPPVPISPRSCSIPALRLWREGSGLQTGSLTGASVSLMTTRTEVVQSNCPLVVFCVVVESLSLVVRSQFLLWNKQRRLLIQGPDLGPWLWPAASEVQSLLPATPDISRSSWTADCVNTNWTEEHIKVYIRNSSLYKQKHDIIKC